MKSQINFSLKANNSFAVESITPEIYYPTCIDDLVALSGLIKRKPFYLLGEGSNTLFFEKTAPAIILPKFFGVEITEDEHGFLVNVGASENWHQLVIQLIEQGINGLENLALIPGTVGAAPIQNIGAYGKDVAMYCQSVNWFSFDAEKLYQLENSACKFAYRDSVFKHKQYKHGIITHVRFYFSKVWQPLLDYGELKQLNSSVEAKQILEKVIEIRQAKLPDPNKLPNAGSFFKNPIVKNETIISLQSVWPKIPVYKVNDTESKIAAGWLIEQAGLKGFEMDNVAVHENQALVIVNRGNNSGKSIIVLAKHIQQMVFNKFSIKIEPEVRLIGSLGEQCFDEIEVS